MQTSDLKRYVDNALQRVRQAQKDSLTDPLDQLTEEEAQHLREAESNLSDILSRLDVREMERREQNEYVCEYQRYDEEPCTFRYTDTEFGRNELVQHVYDTHYRHTTTRDVTYRVQCTENEEDDPQECLDGFWSQQNHMDFIDFEEIKKTEPETVRLPFEEWKRVNW